MFTRFGEKDFAILLPETFKEGAVCVERSIEELAKEYEKQTHGSETSDDIIINIGLAMFPEDGRDSMILLKAAEEDISQVSFDEYGTGTERHG